MNGVVGWLLVAASIAVAGLASFRWLRVAQREHYLPGRVTAFAVMWSRARPINAAVWTTALVVGLAAFAVPALGWLAVGLLIWWPIGLSTRPVGGPFVFTRRVRRLAFGLGLTIIAASILLGPRFAPIVVALSAPLSDLWLVIMRPVENAIGGRFVRQAQNKLRAMQPTVVAITGSYGKTSTKEYATHLIRPARSVVMSPASFNNLMGLSRAINERLAPGTDVFVAEMGTYGVGEIRRLCSVFPPNIAAITTIGEAHLERMRSRSTIVKAKSEITERADTVVLNIDVPELAELAATLESEKKIIRCTTKEELQADVGVVRSDTGSASVFLGGDSVADIQLSSAVHPTNIAIAVGIAHAVGVSRRVLAHALQTLPTVAHRATVHTTENGVVIIDDTYNSNPDGAAQALQTAKESAKPSSTLWVVTPGMVELGSAQYERNRHFASAVAQHPDATLIIVGRTNHAALRAGAEQHNREVLQTGTHSQAVKLVMAQANPGDVVLYENDLPDHYP